MGFIPASIDDVQGSLGKGGCVFKEADTAGCVVLLDQAAFSYDQMEMPGAPSLQTVTNLVHETFQTLEVIYECCCLERIPDGNVDSVNDSLQMNCNQEPVVFIIVLGQDSHYHHVIFDGVGI